MNVTLPADNSN